ncbi:MAG: TIGR03960 family B12-binding radical SAM protein [Deltaproteobacteria bacterium]|nr:TIGR03960 family B12-binding radical SAM protein [Deltaproteobacteria bacterium]
MCCYSKLEGFLRVIDLCCRHAICFEADKTNDVFIKKVSIVHSNLYPGLNDHDLFQLAKPAQYLGGELNSILKPIRDLDYRICLSFPDLYEIGMSNQAIQILYQMLNAIPSVQAERVFMPAADMEAILRTRQLPLVSLESKTPLNQFDMLGFSLAYELCASNVLAILDLGAIPLLSNERGIKHPVILGGGTVAYNPSYLAPFFDAFFIGEAEGALSEIVKQLISFKKNSTNLTRQQLLDYLSTLPGLYVPSIDCPGASRKPIQRQIAKELPPLPSAPLVPNINTVHNRLSLEIMRGCLRACRFCQAGFLYRPLRERPIEQVLTTAKTAYQNSGFDEISLLSLSSSDHSQIIPIISTLMDEFSADNMVSVALPSTRVDALSTDMLKQIARVKRSAFTIAPEAGSQRLRNVINKQISDEQILEAVSTVLGNGWKAIKLYFMIGLPTETDDDIVAIASLARQIRFLPAAKGKNITVSVSTFVPKPHTPFQWAEQISLTETIRRQSLLKDLLRPLRIKYRFHDPLSSMIEGLFSRGNQRLANVLLRAYRLGARLDAWPEHFQVDLWNKSLDEEGIDPSTYLSARAVEHALPWDFIDTRISPAFLLEEYEKSLQAASTSSCLNDACSNCGVCNRELFKITSKKSTALPDMPKHQKRSPIAPVCRIRLQYQKSGVLRMIGHLETVGIMNRAIRRASLPVAYSNGFHPQARISYGWPLPLGVESKAEFVDLWLTYPVSEYDLIPLLNGLLPPDLKIIDGYQIDLRTKSIQEQTLEQSFCVKFSNNLSDSIITRFVPDFSCNGSNFTDCSQQIINAFVVELGKVEVQDGKPYSSDTLSTLSKIQLLSNETSEVSMVFTIVYSGSYRSLKPFTVVKVLTGLNPGMYSICKIAAGFSNEDFSRDSSRTTDNDC